MNEFLWVEKFRAKKVSDIILPVRLKATLQGIVDQKEVPNLIFSGGHGVGKTTAARAILEELGCDYLLINGSKDNGIATLRDDIFSFASSVSFSGGRKYVIIDEADGLERKSFQPAFRGFIEEFSANCGFILTCNFPELIIDPIHSRCPTIDFVIPKEEKPTLAKEFLQRVISILEMEGVSYDKKAVAGLIMSLFPDLRKILGILQTYSVNGTIDSGILSKTSDVEIAALVGFLKAKDFASMRKWVGETDIDFRSLCRTLYDKMYDVMEKNSIPQAVILMADYQDKNSRAVDKEINTVALLTEMMSELTFK